MELTDLLEPMPASMDLVGHPTPSAFKRCTGCGETKVLTAYTYDKGRPDGRCAQCRLCRKAARQRRERRLPHFAPHAKATCTDCKKTKRWGRFYLDPKRRNGLSAWCLPCARKRWRAYSLRHRERQRQSAST